MALDPGAPECRLREAAKQVRLAAEQLEEDRRGTATDLMACAESLQTLAEDIDET